MARKDRSQKGEDKLHSKATLASPTTTTFNCIAANLCQPLIDYLSRGPWLDEPARKSLLLARDKIDSALGSNSPQEKTELGAAREVGRGAVSHQKIKEKAERTTRTEGRAVSKIVEEDQVTRGGQALGDRKIAEQRDDVLSDGSSVAIHEDKKAIAVKSCQISTFSGLPAASSADVLIKHKSHMQKTNSRKRQEKRKTGLVAVNSYTELTERESTLTVMEKLMGRGFSEWYWRKKNFFGPLAFVAGLISQIALLSVFLVPGGLVRDGAMLCYALSCVIFVVHQCSVFSYFFVLRCLTTFEATLLALELCLFAFALSGVFCFSPMAVLFSLTAFSSSCCLGLFDAFPVKVRKRGRNLCLVCSVSFTCIFFLLYARVPKDVCQYRFDLWRGVVDQAPAGGPRPWSFSLFEFLLNRGITIIMLTFKLTYGVFKHPQDCVIIKSRLRVLVEKVKEEAGHHLEDEEDLPSSLHSSNLLPPPLISKHQSGCPSATNNDRGSPSRPAPLDDDSRPANLITGVESRRQQQRMSVSSVE